MKRFFLFSVLFCCYCITNAQTDSLTFFDEFSVSINRSDMHDDNTENRVGYGFGAYCNLIPNKKFNLILGLEYNQTSQLKKRMYEGRFAHSTDVTYNIKSLSLPLIARYNFGSKTKFFLEIGIFYDINIAAKSKGTMYTYSPNQNNIVEYKEYEFSGKSHLGSFNLGTSFGLGIKIPIPKHELMIRPDYKLGFNIIDKYSDDILCGYMRLMIGFKL